MAYFPSSFTIITIYYITVFFKPNSSVTLFLHVYEPLLASLPSLSFQPQTPFTKTTVNTLKCISLLPHTMCFTKPVN